MKKIIVFVFVAVMLTGNALYGEERGEHLLKKHGFSAKAGLHPYTDSDYTDFWGTDESTVIDGAYSRKIHKDINLELSFGYFQSTHNDSALLLNDSSKVEIINVYLSPSAIFRFPVHDRVVLYAEAGPDIYYTRSEHDYQAVTFAIDKKDKYITYGLHGQTGLDWYIYTQPANTEYQAAVSVFLEYKYAYAREIGNADELVINAINERFGTSYAPHDLNIGGHYGFAGIRWHF